MSIVADKLIEAVRALPKDERIPVVRSILKSAGPGVEERVLVSEERFKAEGHSPTVALVSALDEALSSDDGLNIIKVIASAGAQELADQGKIPAGDAPMKAREYTSMMAQLEQVGGRDEGLGWVATLIAAIAAIVSAAASGIASAVRKAKARRRALKRRMTPVSQTEINQLIEATISSFNTFREAEPTILELIIRVREGRTGWLLDPATGEDKGMIVNERESVRRPWNAQKRVLAAQQQAEQARKNLTYGLAAAAGAAVLVGVVSLIAK